MNAAEFRSELERLINQCSMENMSNTPDFVLAKFLVGCLEAFDTSVREREIWYGRDPDGSPGADDYAIADRLLPRVKAMMESVRSAGGTVGKEPDSSAPLPLVASQAVTPTCSECGGTGVVDDLSSLTAVARGSEKDCPKCNPSPTREP